MEINKAAIWPDVVWHLGTVDHCLSAVNRVWSFVDCILVTLNDDDDDDKQEYKNQRELFA